MAKRTKIVLRTTGDDYRWYGVLVWDDRWDEWKKTDIQLEWHTGYALRLHEHPPGKPYVFKYRVFLGWDKKHFKTLADVRAFLGEIG